MSATPFTSVARPRAANDLVTIVAFLAAICAPFLDLWIRPDAARNPEKREMRAPARMPPLSFDKAVLTAFPEQYEDYFNDSYGLRDKLLRWHSIEKVFLFGVSPTHDIYLGRDRWLFYDDGISLENHRGLVPFEEPDLAGWRKGLEDVSRLCAEIGAHFVYVIIPDKESVYPERVPARYNQVGPTRADQLLADLRAHRSTVDVLDLRPLFLAEKAHDLPDEWLYAQLGTHWSGRGSLVATQAILGHLTQRFPKLKVPRAEDYVRKPIGDSGDSWGPRMYIEDWLDQTTYMYDLKVGGWHSHVITETRYGPGRARVSVNDDASLPRAVIFHDSFGPFIDWLMSEQLSYVASYWEHTRPLQEMQDHRPDVVIAMFVERTLNHMRGSEIVPPSLNPWREAYAGSKETLWAPKLEANAEGFDLQEAAELLWTNDSDGTALTITTHKLVDKLVLPDFTPPQEGTAVLRLVIDSPGDTVLSLFFKAPDDPIYRRKNSYTAALKRGRNDLYIVFDKVMAPGRMVLSPGELSGTYQLRLLEARRVERVP